MFKIEDINIWLTNIGFHTKNKKQIEKVCKDIFEKDKTFIYSIIRYYKNFDWLLIIKSCSEDKAHQRGMWFKNKVLTELTYKVIKQ